MPSMVAAGSLADVIHLADNPPIHLQDGALPVVQEPLVLYIARVPGSKDVFLTTMKPRERVVTAQDVQSCLYYLHVDNTEDYKLLQSDESDDDRPVEQGLKMGPDRQRSIRRKPLAPSLNITPDNRMDPSPRLLPPSQGSGHNMNGGTNIPGNYMSHEVDTSHRALDAPPALPARKILGPRAMHGRLHSFDNTALQDVSDRHNVNPRRWSEQPGSVSSKSPLNPHMIRRKEVKSIIAEVDEGPKAERRTEADSRAEHCWDWERSWEQKRAMEAREEMAKVSLDWQRDQEDDASLSLIRRYNGEQWNVGKIVSAGAQKRRADVRNATMSIEIMTKGYSSFMDTDGTVDGVNVNSPEAKVFRRHFQIPRKPTDLDRGQSPETSHLRSFEDLARPSFDYRCQSRDGAGNNATAAPGPRLSTSRGYVLQSPWGGCCEFATGISGRSLKCKHSYASTKSTFGSGTFSAPVSELRFNLPSSKVLGTTASKVKIPGTPREPKRSSRFLGSHHRRTSSSYEDHEQSQLGTNLDLNDRLDLSLGQEHAGGGFGGRQAKLGKLIVEVDGLQMLDFVVAANMALWWKVYDRAK